MSYDFEDQADRSPPWVETGYVPIPHDLEVIVMCLELAAIHLTPNEDVTFSYDELLTQAKDIGGKDFSLEERDVEIVLPFMKTIRKLPGRRFCLV